MSLPTVLVSLLLLLLGGWGLAVLGLALFQERLIYRPDPSASTPKEAGAPWLEPIRKGPSLLGWWVPPKRPDMPVLVVFHGNRGTLARMASKTAPWHHWGFGLFLATYRGFEGNPGHPSESGLTEDGQEVLNWLAGQGFAQDRLVLYGESLGCALALRLAARGPVRALVLEAPFSSLTELAGERHPWAPVRWLLRHRYDNRSFIAGLRLPILILHGDSDRTTPLAHAQRLATLSGPSCRLAVVTKAGHLDLYDKGAGPLLTEFLSGI